MLRKLLCIKQQKNTKYSSCKDTQRGTSQQVKLVIDRGTNLFSDHEFFAKYITWLVGQIGSHCTAKAYPVPEKERQKKKKKSL